MSWVARREAWSQGLASASTTLGAQPAQVMRHALDGIESQANLLPVETGGR